MSSYKEVFSILKLRVYGYFTTQRTLCAVWKSGRSSRLLLLDSDATTRRTTDGWRQLNTLAHYNIPNHSAFILVNHRLTQCPPEGDNPLTRTVNGIPTTLLQLFTTVQYSYNTFKDFFCPSLLSKILVMCKTKKTLCKLLRVISDVTTFDTFPQMLFAKHVQRE